MPLGGNTGLTYARMLEAIEPRPLTSRRRTGRAFFVDTFEHYNLLLTEKARIVGTNAIGVLAQDYPKTGLFCARLTTENVLDRTAYLQYNMGAFPKGKFGIEFDFQCGSGVANLKYISIGVYYYDGVNLIEGRVRWIGTDAVLLEKWQYYDGAWKDVPNGAYKFYVEAVTQPIYHNIKLIADIENELYVRLIYNEIEIDLSALPLNTGVDPTLPQLGANVGITTETNTAIVGRVDNIVFTDQEP